jgi:hypothetical protein
MAMLNNQKVNLLHLVKINAYIEYIGIPTTYLTPKTYSE